MNLSIWSVVDFDADTVARSLRWLAEDERQRARQFRDTEATALFVVTRGALRDLLSRVLDVDPTAVSIRQDPGTAPRLARQHAEADIRISVSHTKGQALVALRRPAGPIGADIEPIDRELEPHVAGYVCTRGERRTFEGLEPEQQRRYLLWLWVRKEAVAKADGRGLRFPVQSLDVAPSDQVAVPEGAGWKEWYIQDLDVGATHVAAVATDDRISRPRVRRWALPDA